MGHAATLLVNVDEPITGAADDDGSRDGPQQQYRHDVLLYSIQTGMDFRSKRMTLRFGAGLRGVDRPESCDTNRTSLATFRL